MSITLTKINATSLPDLERFNYLVTNGLGGYSSLTLAGSATRGDHALFMASIENPTQRYLLVRRLQEQLTIDGQQCRLQSQSCVNPFESEDGFASFHHFNQTHLPTFTYRSHGVTITKELCMPHGKNQLLVRYRVENPMQMPIQLELTPHYTMRDKNQLLAHNDLSAYRYTPKSLVHNDLLLNLHHNGKEITLPAQWASPLYFAYDARDGRPATTFDAVFHEIRYQTSAPQAEFFVVFALNEDPMLHPDVMIENEISRLNDLLKASALQSDLAHQLVLASDAYIIKKDQDETSIIAGYPFFADWGRDSMIASWGALLTTGRFIEMKSLLRSFARYERRGLIPNLFDPKSGESRYNTIDGALLFIISAYYYYQATEDLRFIRDELLEVIESIVIHYQKGTDYQIGMRSNHLIAGGSGEDQLTWMDVNYQGILPTARQGFAVEINAMWYNSLMILQEFYKLLDRYDALLAVTIQHVQKSFIKTFWSPLRGYLADYVAEDGTVNEQLRPNQLFALALPFPLVDEEIARATLYRIDRSLWTLLGLRTLSPDDPQFKSQHQGSHHDRDMAYHQGTIWPFLTGIYGDALLRYLPKDDPILQHFIQEISLQRHALQEGCIGHIAEIYDGANPTQSRGCFAQGWSVSEVLRIVALLEKNKLL